MTISKNEHFTFFTNARRKTARPMVNKTAVRATANVVFVRIE